MEEKKEVLIELKSLKTLIAQLMGSANPTAKNPFSKDELVKAEKEYKNLCIQRGEWIDTHDIPKVIRSAPWDAGSFIRDEFHFTNYFKKGRSYYYNKKDLIALRDELKKRNIHLERYMELKKGKDKLEERINSIFTGKKKAKPFKLPARIKDIQPSEAKKPDIDIVKTYLKELKKEFFDNKYEEYIDIYGGNYAMMKHIYYYEKFIKPEIRSSTKRWVDNFNYVNTTIKMITNKKEVFIPIKEEDQYEL